MLSNCLVTASMLKICSKALSLCSRNSMIKPCLVTASNMCFLLFMISNLYFGQGFGPVWTSEDPPVLSGSVIGQFCTSVTFLLKFQISNKAKMASYVELLKLPIQCHQCLDMVQGGPDGMLDHMYQVHVTTASYPKDNNTW